MKTLPTKGTGKKGGGGRERNFGGMKKMSGGMNEKQIAWNEKGKTLIEYDIYASLLCNYSFLVFLLLRGSKFAAKVIKKRHSTRSGLHCNADSLTRRPLPTSCMP